MKAIKSILVTAIILSTCSTAFAASNWIATEEKQGVIFGGQFGAVSQKPPEGASIKHSLIDAILPAAWRVYTGYQFNKNIAAELGYSLFENDSSAGTATFGPDHYKLSATDLAVKLILPVNKYFNVYAKPGVALVHQDVFNQLLTSDTAPLINSKVNRLTPEIGAGAGLEIIKNVAMDVSYNHIFGSGIVNSIDFAAVGIMVRI